MSNSFIALYKVDDEELNAVMEELDSARETIFACYRKLQTLGYLHIEKKAGSGEG